MRPNYESPADLSKLHCRLGGSVEMIEFKPHFDIPVIFAGIPSFREPAAIRPEFSR